MGYSVRSIYSAIVYNAALGANEDWLLNFYTNFVRPDYVFFLEVSPEGAFKRKHNDNALSTGFSSSQIPYQTIVNQLYKKYAQKFNFVTINAQQSPKQILQDIIVTLGLL